MIQTIRIMGIDAAFSNTGIVLASTDTSGNIEVQELRLVHTEADKAGKKVVRKNSDDLRRAREVIDGLYKAIDDHNPAFVMCEVPFGAQSARAAWALGCSLGIIAAVSARVPVIQVTPKEVKDVVDSKFPDKEQMIAWAVSKYPDANWPKRAGKVVKGQAEHMADAVAALHAGVRTDEFQRTISTLRAMRSV